MFVVAAPVVSVVIVSAEAPKYSVEVYRVGQKRELVWQREVSDGKFHPVPTDASSRGCRRPVAFTYEIPGECRSGYYEMKFSAEQNGKPVSSEAFFVVRSANPGKNAKILLQLATNTYNAYCNWGGYSLYAYNGLCKIQGRRVSFDRPIAGQFRQWELPFITWAESNGYALDYAVNSDLEFHPEILKHYKLVLSVGHDEYWSSPMRDHLEKYIAEGGNVAVRIACFQFLRRSHAAWDQQTTQPMLYRLQYSLRASSLQSRMGRPMRTASARPFVVCSMRTSVSSPPM